MIPDAIVVLSGGIVPITKDGQTHWRSTTYEEGDAFGPLGGRDRVEAAALLAKKYPGAYLVTNSHRLGRVAPSLAQVYAEELRALGVGEERIVQEERSSTTGTAVAASLEIAQEKGWKHLLFVSTGFHIPRVEAFYTQMKSNIGATFVSSEQILTEADPTFADYFEKVKNSPEYQKRLAAEARGIEAIRAGVYNAALAEDKQERSV